LRNLNNLALTKLNIIFIINPISGGKDKTKIPGLIDRYLDKAKFNANYCITEYPGHASEIAAESALKNFDVLVAVGGDGTINEVSKQVLAQDKVLGILPFGSGNGLSRYLRIPMNTVKAIEVINGMHIKRIDTAIFNGKPYFNMAGMGFDAHISALFAADKNRGLSGYVKTGLKEMLDYQPQTYDITVDGQAYKRKAFVVSIANSSQYGNNTYISPEASITDGLLDVCIVKAFPLVKLPKLAFQMLRGSTHKSNMVEIIRGKEIKITRTSEAAIHIDGEPFIMGKEIDVYIVPRSLNIITPDYEA
jgi:diacylglycerol kinase (ATP)